jgi:uncharacterized membrane protein (UPF0127 family)
MRYEILLGILIIAVLALILFYNNFGVASKQGRACFNDTCFNVSLAVTIAEHARGLMFVDHLDEDRGMLFVFEKDGIYPFWMKDTLIPLDIIWIDSDGKVVFISRNNQPCMFTCLDIDPGKQARYVLEINAGISNSIGLAVGDEIKIDFL